MKRCILLLATLAGVSSCQEYKYGPDSERHVGVPKGVVTKHHHASSKIYPGSERDYFVYVPARYKASAPAALMVFQDGGGFQTENGAWRVPVVFDNLIHGGEMPVTIAVMVNPGVMPTNGPDQMSRYNRSYEYDAVNDKWARFLIEEILPEVGKNYNLTADPNRRAICGSSSGGIAAFTAAWFRPDYFRRVMTYVGSYTNLRGGNDFPWMIRKMEPKPLKVFMQDGSRDNNIYSGSWWMGNQDVESALRFAGYDVKFVTGNEGHNSKHGGPIFPDALKWLWTDADKPIAKPRHEGDRQFITMFLHPDHDWELVSEGYKFTEGPAISKTGEVFFTDIPNSRIHKIGLDGKVSLFKEDTGGSNGLMFGPDGRLYACQNGRKRIVAYAMDGTESIIADGVNSNDLVVTAKGDIYFTEPPTKKVWLISKGEKRVVHEGIEFPNGVRVSPDQSLLMVADYRGRWVWSFQIQPGGSLANGQPFYRLEIADESSMTAADGMTVDSEGHLYVATNLGVQICDQPGRVVGIIRKPSNEPLSNLVFAGPNMDTLYATGGSRVYKRQIRRKGVYPWQPVKPPQPGL